MSRTILARAALPSKRGNQEADIILVALDHNEVTPYVTWQHNLEDESTYWGHYHATYSEALTEFHERCRRKGAFVYESAHVCVARPSFEEA
jgi:hypothetical protein